MTSHELAKYLLDNTPDLPVKINGWGSDEGMDFEVGGAQIIESADEKYIALIHNDEQRTITPHL